MSLHRIANTSRQPRVSRGDKPVSFHGDIRRSFIRRGAGDERCRDPWNRWARPTATRLPSTSSRAVTPSSLVTRTGWVTDQPGRPHAKLVTPLLTNLTADQRRIVALCEVPRKQAFLMQETRLSHRTFFRHKRLEPLIQAGLIRATRPDEPHHPDLGVRGDRFRARVPERLAVRCRPHGRCMSSGPPRLVTHLQRLVTPAPGLVTRSVVDADSTSSGWRFTGD